MAVDPVPYVVHGAKHSADVFRQSLHDSTGGAAGVSAPTDLHVRQTGTPSNQVRVNPGGVLIPNAYQGGAGQSYAGRNASETLVDVPASDSTGAKSWNIIFRVQDPQFGGPEPADKESGPYSFIECVAKSATVSDPHYVLAEVEVPASTATVTNAMITDKRSLSNPQWKEIPYSRPRVSADNGAQQFLTATIPGRGEWFPGGSGFENGFSITMPDFAVRMHIEAWWLAVTEDGSKNAYGSYWVEFGDERNTDGKWGTSEGIDLEYEFKTQLFGWNTTGAGNEYKNSWGLADNIAIPKKLRGKRVAFHFKAGIAGGSGASNNPIQMKADSGMMARLMFIQEPESQQVA